MSSAAILLLLLIAVVALQVCLSLPIPYKAPVATAVVSATSESSTNSDRFVDKKVVSTAAVAVIVSKSNLVVEKALNAFDLCLCGAFATAFGDFCMHPIDTIKVMQQTAVGAGNFLDVAKQIIVKSGPLGFYSGVVPYVVADGLSGAIKFATFELSKKFVEARVNVKYHPITQFVCAAGSMLACSVVMVPGEVIKCRMQAGLATSMIDGIVQTVKTDGLRGLFAGYYATLVRDVPYTMLELGLYENIKSFLRKQKKVDKLEQRDELMAAAITGGITAFITTPLDLVKTKLMIQPSVGGQYSGVADALFSIYNAGGTKALFVGAFARVCWLLPFTTIYLGVYESAKKRIYEMKNANIE